MYNFFDLVMDCVKLYYRLIGKKAVYCGGVV